MLVLTIIQGPDKGRVFELPDDEPQLLGRSSEALPISDGTVSRRHAELTPDDGTWWIRDLQSQNGTYVNGVRIGERIMLRAGDQIRTGATLFVFGQTEGLPGADVVQVMRPTELDASVERALASNDDSVILAEPEPRTAAVHHLQVIYRLTALTSRALDQDQLLAGVMEMVFNEFKPERGFIILSSGVSAGSIRPAVVKYRTRPRDDRDARIHVSRTILQHVMRRGEGVLSSNAMNDPRFASGDSVQRLRIRSAICSPISFQEKVYGVIYVDSSIANYTFTEQQLALLNAIGRHTGLALANAEAYAAKLNSERLAAIGQTVASLSHSIKNILQGLRGGADVVEMGLKKEDLKIARGGWSILKRNLDRIMSLTLNMLAYSRQRTLEIELTRLGPLLDDCAQLLQDPCEAKRIPLLIDVDPEMPPVPLDPNLMHQALMNLMTNAVETVPAVTGAVTVRAAYFPGDGRRNGGAPGPRRAGRDGGAAEGGGEGWEGRPHVTISVIDNGPGVPADRAERVFEPFHTTKGARGTGLGLAVTKRIVEDHGGTIEVEPSDGRGGAGGGGGGATFTITLPADPADQIDPSATAQSRREPGDAARRI